MISSKFSESCPIVSHVSYSEADQLQDNVPQVQFYMYVYISVYIYLCLYVCVFVCEREREYDMYVYI